MMRMMSKIVSRMAASVRAVVDGGKNGTLTQPRRAFLPTAGVAAAMALLACQTATAQGPAVGAYIVVDAHSKKVLMASNSTKERPVASLTKIATASVVLDWAEATGQDLNQQARIPNSAAQIQPNPFGFAPGDTISLRDALCCAMMGSDNIAAETLAYFVGADLMRRTGKGRDPFTTFVKQMNSLADKLGMEDTRFLNPHGLDNASKVPYSTAADIARVTLYAMQKPAFSFYTSQPERKVSFFRGGSERQTFLLKNTNTVLGQRGIDGVKTGTTSRAGQCLVLSSKRKSTVVQLSPKDHQIFPNRLVVVVLAAQDRFRDGLWLLDQGWARHEQWAAAGRRVDNAAQLLDPPPDR